MRTEDRFYFGKPGQPERKAKFDANAPWMSEVNRMLRDLSRERAKIQIWISGSDSVTTAGSSRGSDARSLGTTWLVAGRIAGYLQRVPGAVQQHTEQKDYPKKGLWTSFYKVSNLPKELIAYLKNWGIGTSPKSFSGFSGTSAVAYSRPGQPERFGLEDACWDGYEPVGTKQKDGRTVPNCVPKAKNEQPEEFAASGLTSAISEFLSAVPAGATRDALQKALIDYADNSAAEARMRDQGNPSDASRFGVAAGRAAQIAARSWDRLGKPVARLRDFMQGLTRMRFSRPGQPERFDASSLNRADFSDASTSPILGKLLAAKAMPDGGWRAVQAGSDTLVISFEDGDVAGDFGKRAASKGFNATSPVQAIGRYWNVEVKNGK